jgi:hypothetical protein
VRSQDTLEADLRSSRNGRDRTGGDPVRLELLHREELQGRPRRKGKGSYWARTAAPEQGRLPLQGNGVGHR